MFIRSDCSPLVTRRQFRYQEWKAFSDVDAGEEFRNEVGLAIIEGKHHFDDLAGAAQLQGRNLDTGERGVAVELMTAYLVGDGPRQRLACRQMYSSQ